MKKNFAITAFASMALAVVMVPSWSADTATDTAQVRLQTTAIPALHQSIASTGGYEFRSIELKHTAHQLTATIVNSAQNKRASLDREKEAIDIASAMERGMADKPEFSGVGSIHIDYISRAGKKEKTIQIFDFFRSPANVFVLHKT